ncbi:MAG: hypothetical protein U0802_10320 [Candidatus Binatia bacterium]
MITPVVFALHRPVVPQPSPREVESTVWVPLSFLASPSALASYERTLDGVANQYPAFRYERYTIWGLTHHPRGFLEIARSEGPVLG